MEDMNPGPISMGKDSKMYKVLACLAPLKLPLIEHRMCKVVIMVHDATRPSCLTTSSMESTSFVPLKIKEQCSKTSATQL